MAEVGGNNVTKDDDSQVPEEDSFEQLVLSIQQLDRESSASMLLQPESGSLAEKEDAIGPLGVTSTTRLLLFSSVDHLNAVATLQRNYLKSAQAWATLSRAVIELSAIGIWLTAGGSPKERVRRALMWHHRDVRYEVQYAANGEPGRGHNGLTDWIETAWGALDLPAGRLHHHTRPARAEDATGLPFLRQWQAASGTAHGRMWPHYRFMDSGDSQPPGWTHLLVPDAFQIELVGFGWSPIGSCSDDSEIGAAPRPPPRIATDQTPDRSPQTLGPNSTFGSPMILKEMLATLDAKHDDACRWNHHHSAAA